MNYNYVFTEEENSTELIHNINNSLENINGVFQWSFIDKISTFLEIKQKNKDIDGFFFYILYLIFNGLKTLFHIVKSFIIHNTFDNLINLILLLSSIITLKHQAITAFSTFKNLGKIDTKNLENIDVPDSIGGLIGYLLGLLYNGGKFVLDSWHNRKS